MMCLHPMKREDEEGQKNSRQPPLAVWRRLPQYIPGCILYAPPPLEHYFYQFLQHTIMDVGYRCIRFVCKVLVGGEDVNIHPIGLGFDRRGRCRSSCTKCFFSYRLVQWEMGFGKLRNGNGGLEEVGGFAASGLWARKCHGEWESGKKQRLYNLQYG